MNRKLLFILLTLLFAVSATLTPPPAQAAEFTVTRSDDPPPDGCQPGDCSLREAIIAANISAGPDTIALPSGSYNLTIVGTGEDATATGDLDITDDLTVLGADAEDPASTTISAAPDDRVFDIIGPIDVTISNLTISGGYPRLFGSDGGGIFNRGGRLTLTDVIVRENQVLSLGGGIANNQGELILTNVEIEDNFSWLHGGGIFNEGGTLTLTNVDISGNHAYYGLGGGIANSGGEWAMTKVTISENMAGDFGGGIYNVYGTLTLTDSVISDNQATAFSGGGIETVSGILNLTDVEISGNRAPTGGGISSFDGYNRETILTLNKVDILNNQAGYGGGIANGHGSTLIINDSYFFYNIATAEATFAPYLSNDGTNAFDRELVLHSDDFSQNSPAAEASNAPSIGGAIVNYSGVLMLTRSGFNSNQAERGGALYNDGGRATLTQVSLSGNSAKAGGGAIDNEGDMSLERSAVLYNDSSTAGGGILNQTGTLTVTNSTLSGNEATGDGGGLLNGSLVTLNSTTLANNTADADSDGSGDGGGLYNQPLIGTVNLKHVVLAGNSDNGAEASDCGGGELTSQGYNLVQNTTGCGLGGDLTGNLTGVEPLLDSLDRNGGSTLNHMPQTGSPAIDAGDPVACPTSDQRGFARPVDGDDNSTAVCDIGAVEFGAMPWLVYLPVVVK